MRQKILIAVVSLAIIAVAYFYFAATTALLGTRGYSGKAVIQMTSDRFLPPEIKIKRNTIVRFVNTDSLWHWPASNLHPSHTLYPEFDPRKAVGPKEEWSFKFEKVGEWKFHDHLAPYSTGKVIVIE